MAAKKSGGRRAAAARATKPVPFPYERGDAMLALLEDLKKVSAAFSAARDLAEEVNDKYSDPSIGDELEKFSSWWLHRNPIKEPPKSQRQSDRYGHYPRRRKKHTTQRIHNDEELSIIWEGMLEDGFNFIGELEELCKFCQRMMAKDITK